MMLDKANTFSDAQTLAFAAGSALSTYSVDLGATTNVDSKANTVISDLGRSDVALFIEIVEAVLSAGAATVQFELVQADDAALTTNLEVLCSTAALAKAALVIGKQIPLDIPVGITRRYIGLRYTVAVATTTAGKVTASLIAAKSARPTNPTVA